MSKKKFNFRTLVWPKYALSAGILVAGIGAALGALYGYSLNSNEKVGRNNPTKDSELKNVFVGSDKEAKGNFLTGDKSGVLAEYDLETNKVKDRNGNIVDVDTYLTDYYKKNRNLPILNIKYGSFNFFNEYIEAVSPAEFFKFTRWFMTNVSWGPEIITLKSFSIVKGVEQNGNSITLGAHANTNKEYTTITFYPDAFFGSLPIHSGIGGAGNGPDSLVYKVNKNLLTYDGISSFLSKVPLYNGLANVSSRTLSFYFFRNITDIRQLVGHKVYALKKPNWEKNLLDLAVDNVEISRFKNNNPYLLIVNGNSLEEAKINLKNKIKEYEAVDEYGLLKDLDLNSLEEKTITYASINPNEAVDRKTILDRYLNLVFDDGTEYKVFKSFKDIEYKQNTGENFAIRNEELVESIKKGYKKAENALLDLVAEYEDKLEKIASKFNLDEAKWPTFHAAYLKFLEINDELSKTLYPEIAKVVEQLEEIKVVEETKATKEEEKSEKDTQVTTLQTRIDELEAKDSRTDEEETELTEKREEKENLDQEIETLVTEIQELETQLSEFSPSKEELNQQLTKLTIEKDEKLGNLSETIDPYIETIRYDKEKLDDLFKLLTEEYALINEDFVKKLKTGIEFNDENTKYREQAELANKFNELTHNYNNKLQLIATPILDGAVFRPTNFETTTYYLNDLAYLPNQLIGVESLQEISKNAQLNWRDFYNLNGFLDSKNDETNREGKQLYLYATDLHSLEDEFNKSNPNTEFKFEFTKLQEELKNIAKELNEIESKRNDHEHLALKVSEENQNPSVSNYLSKYFDASREQVSLPENYKLLGYDVFSQRESSFNFFIAKSYEKGKEYLELALNGNPNAGDNTKDKEGFLAYFNRIAQPILNDTDKKSAFEELKALDKERVELGNKLRENIDNVTQDQQLEVSLAIAKFAGKEAIFNEAVKDQNINYSQLTVLVEMKEALEESLKLMNKMIEEREQYKEESAQSFALSLDTRFVNFKINFLLNSPSFTDANILEAYQKVVAEYEKERTSVIERYKENVAQKDIAWFMQRAEGILLKVKYDKYKSVFADDVTRTSLETTKNGLESEKPSAEENKNTAQSALTTVAEELNNVLTSNNYDENTTLDAKLETLYNDELSKVTEILAELDKLRQSVEDSIDVKTLSNEIQELENQYKATEDDQEKERIFGQITLKITELNNLNNLQLVTVTKNLFNSGVKSVLDNLKVQKDANLGSYADLISLNETILSTLNNETVLNTLTILRNINRENTTAVDKIVEFIDFIGPNTELNEKLNEAEEYTTKLNTYNLAKTTYNENKDKLEEITKDLATVNDALSLLDEVEADNALNEIQQKASTSKATEDKLYKELRDARVEETIISAAQPKNAEGKPVDNLRYELNQLMTSYNENDEIISKAKNLLKDLSDENSAINQAKTKIQSAKEKVNFDAEAEDFKEEVDNLTAAAEEYLPNIKQKTLLNKFKEINASDSGVFYEKLLEALNIDDEDQKDTAKEELKKYVENPDSLIQLTQDEIDKVKNAIIQISSKKDQLFEHYEEVKKAEEDYLKQLETLYKEVVLKGYALISKDQLKDADLKDLVLQLDVKISDLKAEIYSLEDKKAELIKIDAKYNDVVTKLAELEANSEIQDAANKYAESFFAYAQNDLVIENHAVDILKMLVGKAYDKHYKNVVEPAEVLLEEIKNLEERLEEIQEEKPDTYEEDEEYVSKSAEKEQKEAELEPVQELYNNYFEPFGELYDEAESSLGQSLTLEAEEDEENQSQYDQANELLNAAIEQDEAYGQTLDALNTYINEYTDYAKNLDGNFTLNNSVIASYEEIIKQALENLINIRNNEILKKAKQLSLVDSTNLGDELTNENQLITAASQVELINILTKKGLLTATSSLEDINKVVHKVELTDIKKEGKKLVFTLRKLRSSNERSFDGDFSQYYAKFNVDATTEDDGVLNALDRAFKLVGFKKVVVPSLLKEEGNVKNVVTNKTEKGYSLYNDAYQGLLDTLIKRVPYAAEWLNGEHIVTKINDEGETVYSIENGPYLGFTRDTRIGLWAILKMSDPNFKGVPIDFLKFVAAHEYGHHFTLNAASDLGNKADEALFISALLPGASPNINNYYNKLNLDLYLKARTNLELNSDRLLEGEFIEKNYGEYPLFKLPSINASGELEYKAETEEEIWGTQLSENNIIKAMLNNRRRFLQNFDGLKNAAKARREENNLTGENEKLLKTSDLWIMNSLDHFSGTLNPTVTNGIAKYLVKQEDGSYLFTPGSLNILKGILKDGQGNDIQFEEVNGNVVPKIVDGERNEEGKYILIREVLVKNADGTGIVNIPLNVKFGDPNDPLYDANSVTYVNDEIDKVAKTINSLIVQRYDINGWDTPTTDLTVTPKLVLDWPQVRDIFFSNDTSANGKQAFNSYRDMILGRDPEQGARSSLPITSYNLDGSINSNETARLRNFRLTTSQFYVNPGDYDEAQIPNEMARALTAMWSTRTFTSISNGGRGYVSFLDRDHQYIVNAKASNLEKVIAFDGWSQEVLDFFGLKNALKNLSGIQADNIGIRAESLFQTLKEDGTLVDRDSNFSGEIPNWEQTKTLKINTRALGSTFENDLFGLYGNDKNGKGAELTFDEYADFFEFTSLDLKKARLDKEHRVVNWDIDYVKTKVSDFEAFKQALKVAVEKTPSLSAEEVQHYLSIANSADEQVVANEIIKRFSESKLALFTSHISIQDIVDNNELAWFLDQTYGYGLYKVNGLNLIQPNPEKWEFDLETYLQTYRDLSSEMSVTVGNTTLKPTLAQFSMYDAMIFNGEVQTYTTMSDISAIFNRLSFANLYATVGTGAFKTSRPSEDVVSYYGSKTDRRFNEKFSDYTFSWSEIINRDNLQITYSPSRAEFGNLPSYLKGLSESTTGLEYVVDGTPTQKWKDALISYDTGERRGSIKRSINEYEQNLDQEARDKARNLDLKYNPAVFVDEQDFNDAFNYNNNYFGEFRSINNGWFKDRWYRDILDFKLYDDKGVAIEDDTIRITDLKGEKVTNRPKAFWEFYIQAQGVGKRNLSTIWRNTDKDAVAFFGYLTSDIADKAKYLAFKDLESGEIETIELIKENTNNMFYYKSQSLDNEGNVEAKHTLKDEEYNFEDLNGQHSGKGFVSWVTDYAVVSKYRNKLLTPGKQYYVYFASDKKGTKALELELGNVESVSENGKTFKQAPVTIHKASKDEFDGKYYNKAIATIKDQFNGAI
ncbi:hypothetical protein MCSF7_02998 [Mycoplasmopsis columbina SF7]|uniref:Uncharacterized protein n=1 Tax=Mycoplasmopsis columbina SF7 TaxID=1037410 RepID=F9UJE1_9BACT|nr:PDxFFG protein [Mycoplasmopsis columbina]EGV00484.1 hypothetical protein MCSF7_02998 [Mycoplasmopsis columbina SF7]